jgi:hypothetical protein
LREEVEREKAALEARLIQYQEEVGIWILLAYLCFSLPQCCVFGMFYPGSEFFF